MSDRPADASVPLRVLLVDDESPARLRLASLVAECPSPRAEVAGEAANATQALVWLAGHRCDVVLADIAMPGRDGLQLAAEVGRLPAPPVVVFVTAHAGHALAAFELAAVDYLTKPVRRERLHAALQRVAARRRPAVTAAGDFGADGGSAGGPAGEPTAEALRPAGGGPVLVVHEAGRVLRIPAVEVLYLKAELKYVTLRTERATHLLDDALADLEQRLGSRFLRVHRNALVARDAIRALERRSAGGTQNGEWPARPVHEGAGLPVRSPVARGSGGDGDAGSGWAVLVHPVGEWLAVSRRQLAVVRETLRQKHRR